MNTTYTETDPLISELVIEPGRTEKNYWNDLWRYRELFYILSWRDIRVRYKQTVIGAAGKPDIFGFLFEHGTLVHQTRRSGRPLEEDLP